MRKCISIMLIIWILLSLCGCGQQNTQLQSPANFYYPVNSKYRGEEERVIQPELRESAGCEKNLLKFTELYILGPQSERLVSIFPDDCYPVSVCHNGPVITVYMSPGFSRLTGIDLTMACACLSATLMDYAKANTVNICVKGTRLDDQRMIVMTMDSFSLVDENFLETSDTEPE